MSLHAELACSTCGTHCARASHQGEPPRSALHTLGLHDNTECGTQLEPLYLLLHKLLELQQINQAVAARRGRTGRLGRRWSAVAGGATQESRCATRWPGQAMCGGRKGAPVLVGLIHHRLHLLGLELDAGLVKGLLELRLVDRAVLISVHAIENLGRLLVQLRLAVDCSSQLVHECLSCISPRLFCERGGEQARAGTCAPFHAAPARPPRARAPSVRACAHIHD